MRQSGSEEVYNSDHGNDPLLFVAENPSSRAVTSSNRTAVRSQLTKNYWRQARLGRDNKKKGPYLPLDRNSHRSRISAQSPNEAERARDPSGSGSRASPIRQKDILLEVEHRPQVSQDVVDAQPRFGTPTPHHRQDLPNPISMLRQGIHDPFQSYPSDMEASSVAKLTHHSIEELWPALRATDDRGSENPLVKHWFAPSITHPALFHALMFGAAVHLQARKLLSQPSGHLHAAADTPELLALQYRATQWLNKTMQDPVLAPTDETICAVMVLACSGADLSVRRLFRPCFDPPLTNMQWLDVYATVNMSEMHFRGLELLLKMRGGLANLDMEGVADIIVTGDLIHASKHLIQPRFPWYSSYKPERRRSSQSPVFGDLERTEEAPRSSFWTTGHPGLPEELLDVMQSMHNYIELIKTYIRGTIMKPDMNRMVHYRNQAHHKLLTLPPAAELGEMFTHMYPWYEPCRLAGLIFGIGVTFPLPVWAAPFARLVALLQESLGKWDFQSVKDNDMPLLLWVLVVGSIAAQDFDEKKWLVSTVGLVIMRLRVRDWESAKEVLRDLLWLDSACEVSGRRVWEEASLSFGARP